MFQIMKWITLKCMKAKRNKEEINNVKIGT